VSAWGFMPAAGPLYAPFFVYFQSYLVLGLVRLLRAHRAQVSSFRRNRTLLVILGVAVSLLGGAVDFVRFIARWDWLYPIGIPANAVFALALGVAIVRYRLVDVGLLARRTVLYLLTSAALAPILFAARSPPAAPACATRSWRSPASWARCSSSARSAARSPRASSGACRCSTRASSPGTPRPAPSRRSPARPPRRPRPRPRTPPSRTPSGSGCAPPGGRSSSRRARSPG